MANPDSVNATFAAVFALTLAAAATSSCAAARSAQPPVHVLRTVCLGSTVVKEKVGGMALRFRGDFIAPGGSTTCRIPSPRHPFALLLRLVVTDDLPGHTLAFTVDVNGSPVAIREIRTEGVGRRSQFIRVEPPVCSARRQTVTIRNTGREPLFAESLLVLDGYQEALAASPAEDGFILSFLIDSQTKPDDPALRFLRGLKRPVGTTFALSTEIPFAQRGRAGLLRSVESFGNTVRATGWPAVVSMVSWWAGTPPEVGENIAFQQICYSRTDTLDEGPELKALLGDRWRLEYGLTIPNRWSNTPWQTMNNPELNALRQERMSDIFPALRNALRGLCLAYITENEPMYWAGEFPDEDYPVKREDLMADFNPHTVAAAARDGVTLDPTDGLDMRERQWLCSNLNKYVAETATWIGRGASGALVFTHALLEDHYPMKGTGRARPAMEMAITPAFPAGVEMLWDTSLDKILRLRELGPWGCVNREENDGRPWTQHAAMALAVYAAGGRLLNSYNWQAIPAEAARSYFNSFAESLPERVSAGCEQDAIAARWRCADGVAWMAGVDPDCPWGTCLRLRLRLRGASQPEPVTLEVREKDGGALVGWSRVEVPAGDDAWVNLPLDCMTSARQHTDLTFRIRCGKGVELALDQSGHPLYQWVFSAAEERARSRIIQHLLKR